MIQIKSCFFGVAVVILFLILGVLILIRLGIIKFNSYYKSAYESTCQSRSYLPIPSFQDPGKALLAISYNVSLGNCVGMGPIPPIPGYDVQKQILGSGSDGITRVFAYLFHSSSLKSTIIAFTNTIFIDQWEDDLDMDQVPFDGVDSTIKVHHGFYNIFSTMVKDLTNQFNLVKAYTNTLYITGHSLGAGLATLEAYNVCLNFESPLNIIVYTFASPRALDINGAEKLDKMLPTIQRIFNTEDLIPTLPLSVEFSYLYQHVGNNISFTVNTGDTSKNHLEAYLSYYGLS